MKKKILFISMLLLLFNCEAIFIENISDENVVLLAPSNNLELPNGNIIFNWQKTIEASEYQFQIAKPNFDSTSQILIDSTTTVITISKELEIGEYEWRVKALNSDYSTNYTTYSFTVN